MQKRYLPVSFERVTVRQPCQQDLESPAQLASAGTQSGVRGLTADLRMNGASKRILVDVEKARLLASDQGPLGLQNASAGPSNLPYTRLVWTPDFDFLTEAAAKKLHPPKLLDDGAVAPALNELALLQLVEFHNTHPQILRNGSEKPHLQYLLDWMSRKTELIKQDYYPQSKQIFEYSSETLSEKIAALSQTLNTNSPESRTMCHIYRNLEPIFNGEKTGIQVALEHNLLSEMYESGQITKEGNRRLASIVELLSYQTPSLRILEVGAGTGSATREILAALKGESIYRKYTDYIFTDITPSFLNSAEEKLSEYRGVTYDTFDMQKASSAGKFEASFDLVVASNVGIPMQWFGRTAYPDDADFYMRLSMHHQTSWPRCEISERR